MVLVVFNVFFRDVVKLFGVVLQFWFWLTPIIYPASILPERLQPLMALNPMASVMTAYQTILVRGEWPDWGSLWVVTPIDLTSVVQGKSVSVRVDPGGSCIITSKNYIDNSDTT